MLAHAGYVAAVQVPEQKIESGSVQFNVLMAHLTQVRVRGNATGAERTIAGYLDHLTKEPVFNRYDAERYLLLASDLPGYTVRLTLRPAGTVPGEVIGDVAVQRTPAYVDLNIQNGGSDELGPWGALARAQFFGLTGLGDRTLLSVFTTPDLHEQQTVQLGHEFRVGSEGLTFGDTFTYAWARPSVPKSEILARTLLNTFEVSYPLVRRQASTLRLSAGMDYVNQDVRLDNIRLTRDRLRVGYVRLAIDASPVDTSGLLAIEPLWRLSSEFELRQGFHILGATGDCGPLGANCLGPNDVPPSRIEGQSDATVLRFTAYGELHPAPALTFALGTRMQYSWKPLLSFEEFSAGNYTVGRGYDPGSLLGDRGFGTRPKSGSDGASRPQRTSWRSRGTVFWDHAWVHNLRKALRGPGLDPFELGRRRRSGGIRPLYARRCARLSADPDRD